ncbi:NrdH-redoxin [Aminithiophilus ramosus]|uniref:NrdH-redoxin n=2 Tax=Synergistales TaxID=649776 RepID=A0A9Q7F040_9BACT|nr:glutaredoxin domain-containing protein [Aminithiophilus ramosus]QTX32802.1 NrdH-redoxin [Aminithiophilus ramosus]QVL36677.1 NrdH-redoxin [Synergistota bacterium]
MTVKAVVYVTSTCPWCHRLQDYLTRRGVSYEAIDVGSGADKIEEVRRISGQMGVPVTVLEEHVIVGFDRDAIDEALASCGFEG